MKACNLETSSCHGSKFRGEGGGMGCRGDVSEGAYTYVGSLLIRKKHEINYTRNKGLS